MSRMDDPVDDESSLLPENDPCSDAWTEASFLGRLMEESLFDEDAYGEVETDMIRAVTDGADFETFGMIIRIVERTTLMLKRHVDPRDEYNIKNLSDRQAYEIDKRIRFFLVEVSLGNAPDMSRV
jgi:Immunity protein 41